jgi:hypothetical protein
MNAAVLVYHGTAAPVPASLVMTAPLAGKILWQIPVAWPPNMGVFPHRDCVLVSYLRVQEDGSSQETLDVYRMTDGGLRGRLIMDCRAHFNAGPRWSTFLPSPDPDLIYVYKAATLGDHLAADYVCGLHLTPLAFTAWNFQLPECMAGWSPAGRYAHAQMLFVADGIEAGRLPTVDLDQKVGFWLGPEEGMGPTIKLGPRPRIHSDLGHARAILLAPEKPLSIAVCNDGTLHLLDPVGLRYLQRQRVPLADDHGMPIFAAQVDRAGRFLYVGTGSAMARCVGQYERVVVYDLDQGTRVDEWHLSEPMSHLAISPDGRYLLGSAPRTCMLTVLNARSAAIESAVQLDGVPRYVEAGS